MTDEAPSARGELASWCLERLAALAAKDPMAWYPIFGWVADDGSRLGFAVERFGTKPTYKQIHLLTKALTWLQREDRIETARCRRRSDERGLVLPPLDGHVWLRPRESGGIRPWNSEYVARLPYE